MPSLTWPLSIRGTVTQPFGAKNSMYVSGYHTGIDIGAPTGTPIVASHAGTVTWVGYAGAYGNQVKIVSGNAETWYNHMVTGSFAVRSGQQVAAGQKLGTVGSTGQSTGPHLHLELRVDGKSVDPMPYLNGANLPAGGGTETVGLPGPLGGLGGLDALDQLNEVLGFIKGMNEINAAASKIANFLKDPHSTLRIGMFVIGLGLVLTSITRFNAGKVVQSGVNTAAAKVKQTVDARDAKGGKTNGPGSSGTRNSGN